MGYIKPLCVKYISSFPSLPNTSLRDADKHFVFFHQNQKVSNGSTDKIYVAFFRNMHAQTYRSALAKQKMVVYGIKREA